MSGGEGKLAGMAAQLRADFDGAFAQAHAAEAPPHVDLLLIGVAERSYALRLSEVTELLADRRLVPVPSPRRDLLGLAGLRGVVTPVYDLALQLGHAAPAEPRWLVQVRAAAAFALAFERFDRHLRVPSSDLAPARDGALGTPFSRASVRLEQYPLPVLDLPAIFESVARRRAAPERPEERR
ncbi:MAG: chemotaxis protein CheW [Myxococcales bacterium]|nr:MAG: chemotaxis protein CheW [Myxococcales bacterium]